MDNHERLRQLIGDDAFEALTPDEIRDLSSGDGDWLDQLLLARSELPIEDPPALLSQSLRDLFDVHRLVQSYEAVLVADSRIDRRLVGVRGMSGSSAWSLSYTCEAADIVLDVTGSQDHVIVDAHVMSHGNQAVAYGATVRPMASDGIDDAGQHGRLGPPEGSKTAESDRLGRIRLGEFRTTPHHIIFRNLRSVIELTVDFGPAPS